MALGPRQTPATRAQWAGGFLFGLSPSVDLFKQSLAQKHVKVAGPIARPFKLLSLDVLAEVAFQFCKVILGPFNMGFIQLMFDAKTFS